MLTIIIATISITSSMFVLFLFFSRHGGINYFFGEVEMTKPLDVQIGGDHYKQMKIQPMEYSMANDLDACQHTIVKYVTRHESKGGKEDLLKARHCIDLLIQFKYPDEAAK